MVRKKIIENQRHEKPYGWRKGKLNEKNVIPTINSENCVSFLKMLLHQGDTFLLVNLSTL
jgi:hypothetical protein